MPKGIVTQATLGKTLVARGQQIGEAVTGASPREKRAAAREKKKKGRVSRYKGGGKFLRQLD